MKVRYAVRVFAIKDDKIMCIRYKDINKDFFDVPGGKIEDGESEVQACQKEFKEETGMTIDELKCIGKIEIIYPAEDKKYAIKTYIASKIDGTPQEFSENYACWVPIKKLIAEEKRLATTHLLDDDLRKYLYDEKVNMIFTCDSNHNVINMDIR